MKVLFVGLGSIGKRHLQNLATVCKAKNEVLEVVALRHEIAPLPQEIEQLVKKQITQLFEDDYFDVAFITNPTYLHAEIIGQLRSKINTYFIEKPIFENTKYSLEELGLLSPQKAYVAAPMRWCGVYLALKQQIIGLPIYSVRSICSSYLPEWRTNVDYRTVYSAYGAQGGGVTLDLIHEWDYLVDLFGEPEKTYNFRGKYSDLEIDSDDLSVYIAEYSSFLCELHLDYFGRKYRREVEIFSQEGTFKADFGTGELYLPDGSVESYDEPVNERYLREMEYFVNYVLHEQEESVNSPAHAFRVLQITLGE